VTDIPKFDVEFLDTAGKAKVIDDWRLAGLAQSKLNTVETNFIDNNCCWYAVKDASKIKAIFEVRSVPLNGTKYFKNMRVDFAPDLDTDNEGQSFEDTKEVVMLLTRILATIFYHLLDKISGEDPKDFQIYNDHPMVRTIFYHFANYLSEELPDEYKVTFYSKWIKIEGK
jgi:hypothetical protein